MTVKEVSQQIEGGLERLRQIDRLPAGLEALRYLVPAAARPRVYFRYVDSKQSGRKVREDASADYIDQRCEAVIRYEAEDEALANLEEPLDQRPMVNIAHSSEGHSRHLDDLLRALDEAERTRDFVGLTWFRDQFLPSQGLDWAEDRRLCGQLIHVATDQALVLTGQVPNPRDALRPVTSIRTNRSHPRFRQAASRQRGRPHFRPVRISGKALSATVREDRR